MPHDLTLAGCVSTMLAAYLKALGVHRIVAEQLDPGALSYWDEQGRFHLVSVADREALVAFLCERYAPTPIVTPWSGGSGFYPKDQKAGLHALKDSSEGRFAAYRQTITTCEDLVAGMGLSERPKDDDKRRLLLSLRRELPDEALRWLDAAVVVGEEARYPALLGTGGNDGRLDFANNFMQRLTEALLGQKKRRGGTAGTGDRVDAAIFGGNADGKAGILEGLPIGQFAPAAAGGVNMSSGIEGQSRVNPWDYILALEGALLFAGAAVRRLEAATPASAAFPFQVAASAVGYGSAADAEQDRQLSRGELWLPIWGAGTSQGELQRLFGEGRLDVGRRRAVNGLEAARAMSSLGVDRGLSRFERIGFLRRNGLSYLATYLGPVKVTERKLAHIHLLDQLDDLLGGAERADRPEVGAALRPLKEAIFAACRADGPDDGPGLFADVLAEAGAVERAIGRAVKLHDRLRPCRPLAEEWYEAARDGSPEFDLAAAVASWGIRAEWEPVDSSVRRFTDARVGWGAGDVFDNILGVARRRLLRDGAAGLAGSSAVGADGIARLLGSGQTGSCMDRRRLERLLFGLSLLERCSRVAAAVRPPDRAPNPAFCLLRAVTSPLYLSFGVPKDHPAPQLIQVILARLGAEDVEGALALAARRLKASGVALKIDAPERRLLGAVEALADRRALALALVIPLPAALERRLIETIIICPAEMIPGAASEPTETAHA